MIKSNYKSYREVVLEKAFSDMIPKDFRETKLGRIDNYQKTNQNNKQITKR